MHYSQQEIICDFFFSYAAASTIQLAAVVRSMNRLAHLGRALNEAEPYGDL